MADVPLPKVDYDAGWHRQYTADQMHAYAAAVSAAKDERIKVLEDALRKAVVQNEHDMLMTGEELRAARAALGDKNG